MINLPHVASRVFGTPLLVARPKLEVILSVLAPRLAGKGVDTIAGESELAPLSSITVERIAVVSLIGTLVSRSSYLDAASGRPRRHARPGDRRDGGRTRSLD